jgi:hypothetical protein
MLQKFVMAERNTCAECGAEIKEGADVYANNFDEVRSGNGVCSKHAPKTATAKKAIKGEIPDPKNKK